MSELSPLPDDVLPSGARSRFVRDINGLRMHVLEAGFETHRRPLVLLLHGFPELAYSWRKVMLPLAAAGFRVVAPDHSLLDLEASCRSANTPKIKPSAVHRTAPNHARRVGNSTVLWLKSGRALR
jgi:hypothetical protein